MKTPAAIALASAFLTGAGLAQTVVPGTPGKFKPRAIGGGTSGSVEIVPKEDPKVRYTTYITLSSSRPWTSTEGKTIEGKLIAFENMVVEAVQGAPPAEPPEPPKYPTVVRDGKARLLVNRKPVEIPLSRLVQDDRDFIEKIRFAREKPEPEPRE